MIAIESKNVGNIPILHVAKHDLWEEKLPFIIFHHGITSTKEVNLHYAYLLAEQGFRVVLPDAMHHGLRKAGLNGFMVKASFWNIVIQSIREIETIKTAFEAQNNIDSSRIGVAGTSMGGVVTLGAMATYDWIHTGASLMGNPAYESFAKYQIETILKEGKFPIPETEVEKQLEQIKKYDLSQQMERLAGRPLMFWHGAKDKVVPYEYGYEMYKTLIADYGYNDDRLMYILDKKAGHKVSQAGIKQMVAWFERHLQPAVQNI